MLSGMPTGTRPDPTPEEEQIAALLRAAMASKIPAWNQQDLARATGIESSGLSRALRARRGLYVYELLRICLALGLDAGQVIDEARRRVRVMPEPVDAVESARAAGPDLSELHSPRPEDNRGVASRPAHAPARPRVAGGRGTRPPHS